MFTVVTDKNTHCDYYHGDLCYGPMSISAQGGYCAPEKDQAQGTWVGYYLKCGIFQFGEWDTERGMWVSEGIIRLQSVSVHNISAAGRLEGHSARILRCVFA